MALATNDGSPADARHYRPATTQAVRGFERLVLQDSTVLYLAENLDARVVSHDDGRSRAGKSVTSTLSIDGDAATSLAMLVRDAGVDRLVVLEGNRVLGTVAIRRIGEHGLQVSQLVPEGTTRPSPRSTPTDGASELDARVTIVPRSGTVRPGETITADVYATGVRNLRTFQMAVDATGPDGTRLELESAQVDPTREDHVFFGKDALDAADTFQGRLGAVLFHESVSAEDARYLGSFMFSAGTNQTGTYRLVLRTQDSFLNDDQGHDQPYTASGAAIQVGWDVSDGKIR